MKKLSLVSISLFLLGLSFSVFAAKSKRVSFIKIEGGHIAAKGKLSIDLSKLENDGYYQLRCNIRASDSAMMNFNANYIDTRDELINGKSTRAPIQRGTNVALDKGDNSFIANISVFYKSGARLNIINLDDTVIADVTHCSATPIEL